MNGQTESEAPVQIGDFVVDPVRNTLSDGDREQQIPGRVMDVLIYLATHNDRVIPAEELLNTFWPDRVVEESTVHRVINQLRKALNDSARNPQYILTVSKRGYQLIASVNPINNAGDRTLPLNPPTVRHGRTRVLILLAGTTLLVSFFLLLLLWPDSADHTASPQPVLTTNSDASDETDHTAEILQLNSIAVLPFVNMSTDEALGYFADGLADSILDALSQEQLKVASRTAATDAVTTNAGLSEIAQLLGVMYVIEGGVQQQGEDVRTTVQLIRAEDGYHVWSKVYDRLFTDVFAMQSELSRNISSIVQALLSIDVERRHPQLFRKLRDVDPEAMTYYLDGQEEYVLYLHGEGGNWEQSVQLIRKAASLDPDFLAAQQQLAWSYLMRMGGTLSLAEAQAGAHAAIGRVMALDPDNSDSLLQLAQIRLYLDLDYQAAQTLIERDLEIHPRARWWYPMLAGIAFREGREADGLKLLETAAAVDYQEEQVNFYRDQIFTLMIVGRYQQALGVVEQALQLVAGGAQKAELLGLKAWTLILLNRGDEALPFIEEIRQISGALEPERYAYLLAYTGRELEARQILEDAVPLPDKAAYMAVGYLALGDVDSSLQWLETGIEEHDPGICLSLRLGRFWDPIRDDPRFSELISLLASKETRTTDLRRPLN